MKVTKINVIQFGTGNFLRAFIEPIFQDLKNKGIADPNICLIESTGSGKVKEMSKGDFNYPVWITGVDKEVLINEEIEISCVQDGISLPTQAFEFLELAQLPELEWIISNVTEAGFTLAIEEEYEFFPISFPARLTRFLHERFVFFKGDPKKGLQILPCELIEKNGDKLLQMMLDQSDRWNLGEYFKNWLIQNNTIYNTLVDRIVTGLPSTETLDKFFPSFSSNPFRVQAEPYFLLALSGKTKQPIRLNIFQADYPILQVKSIEPFALRKVRILNGAHIAMVVMGIPEGIKTVSGFLQRKDLFSILQSMILDEVIPFIGQSEAELIIYSDEIWDRFRNPFVEHKLRDISLNTIAKLSPRILDSISSFYSSQKKLPKVLTKIFVTAISNYLEHPERIRDTQEVINIFEKARKLENPNDKAEYLLYHPGLWTLDLSNFEGLKEALIVAIK